MGKARLIGFQKPYTPNNRADTTRYRKERNLTNLPIRVDKRRKKNEPGSL